MELKRKVALRTLHGRWGKTTPKIISKEGYLGQSRRDHGKRSNSCAIVTQEFIHVQLLHNYCAIVAPRTLKNKGKCLATGFLWEALRRLW